MRIIVPSDGNGFEGNLSGHFGRCPEFVLIEAEEDRVTSTSSVKNPYFKEHVPFAVPQFLISLKPNVIITGGMGHRALSEFKDREIEVITGAEGKIRETVNKFLEGKLERRGNICSH
ncbi:MAG: NifB/NifX family molybdenum-iron cluster-binding protein [Candidatus Micrarchaeota archaeon]